MNVTITPAALHGVITPPPSKSEAHRLLIAAALADGESRIDHVVFSRDIEATVQCLAELGAEFEREGACVLVRGMGANTLSAKRRLALPHLDCGESGSTLRFLIPVALAVRGGGIFTGHGRLMERPLEPYFALFREKGIFFELKDGVLTVQGELAPGEYSLPGNVSSQFFTGLLFSLPLLDGGAALIPTTRLESYDYILMTLQAMGRFGVQFPMTMSIPPQYHMPGNQTYQPAHVSAERDWSQAAFWYAAEVMGSGIEVAGMDPNSVQGDKVFLHWALMARDSGSLTIDVSNNPDLVPPLAAMGAVRDGTLHIKNAVRLRMKESDRLSAAAGVLNALGAEVQEEPDGLIIAGKPSLAGGVTVDCHNDHRIAMMAAIASTRCDKPVTLTGAECVDKSYPDFWADYAALGGQLIWSQGA